jgi:hypothetical protein
MCVCDYKMHLFLQLPCKLHPLVSNISQDITTYHKDQDTALPLNFPTSPVASLCHLIKIVLRDNPKP